MGGELIILFELSIWRQAEEGAGTHPQEKALGTVRALGRKLSRAYNS